MTKLERQRELLGKIKSLQVELMNIDDLNTQLNLENEIYKSKIELNNLIVDTKSKRAGMSAKTLLSKKLKDPVFYETGIMAIDMMGGIPLGALIQLGASSGAGKTTTLLKILSVFSKTQKVVHFDFEMGDIKLARKLNKLLTSDIQKENYTIDFESYKLEDLVREIEIYSADGIKFFVVDSRMKIKTNEKFIADSTAKISSELQRLCRENNITIMLINQMSENSIQNGLPTLKGGNDQFYDADVVMFLYKKIVKKGKDGMPDEINNESRTLYISKNRFGKEYFAEILKGSVEPHEVRVNVYESEMPNI